MIGDLRKVWAILTVAERRKAAWMLALITLMAAVDVLGVLSVMPFLSALGRPEAIHENPFLGPVYDRLPFESNREFLAALGFASIATVVCASTFKAATLYAVNRFVHLLRHSISARLLSRYLHQPYEFFLARNPSQLSRNALSEADHLLAGLIHPVAQMFAQGAIVCAMIGLVLWYDPRAAVAILATVTVLYAAIYRLARKRLQRIGQGRHVANGLRFQSCNEALSGIKDVKISHATRAYMEKFVHASRDLSRYMAAGDTLAQTPLYMVEAIGYSGLILFALALMFHRNDIAQVLPALGLYGFAAYRLLPAAQIMYRGFAKLRFSSSALETIHRDLMLTCEEPSSGTGILAPSREIRLDNVTFSYPGNPAQPILERFSIVIPSGGSIGIVGRSGAGKSTLMDLLLGLLAPQAGTLSVDGVVIDPSNVHSWQRAIGYVPQHVYLADASVAENIAFGIAKQDIDMAAVKRAAAVAQIHDFIVSQLESGYDTPIGDRGIRLSGGQRQRIGIARALYRDPPVIFLDEATSALDSGTEAELSEALKPLLGKKTLVVVAHKKSFLSECDAILSI